MKALYIQKSRQLIIATDVQGSDGGFRLFKMEPVTLEQAKTAILLFRDEVSLDVM